MERNSRFYVKYLYTSEVRMKSRILQSNWIAFDLTFWRYKIDLVGYIFYQCLFLLHFLYGLFNYKKNNSDTTSNNIVGTEGLARNAIPYMARLLNVNVKWFYIIAFSHRGGWTRRCACKPTLQAGEGKFNQTKKSTALMTCPLGYS